MGLGCWGLAVGPTAALRLGTWGAVGGMLGRRRRCARAGFAVRRGGWVLGCNAKYSAIEADGAEVMAARGVCGACGVCVSRETRCLSRGWRATSSSIFSA